MSLVQLIGQPQKIGNVKRKSIKPDFFSDALDWKIYRAAKVPGPGAYDVAKAHTSLQTARGSRWGKCNPMSYLEMAASNAKNTPGPGEYQVDEASKSLEFGKSGGRFNTSKTKSHLDWVVYQAKDNPAPNQYSLPNLNDPSRVGGGKFNQSRGKTDVEWTIYRAKQLPAPGEYGSGILPGPSGGKFNTSKSKSELDWTVMRAAKTPGPGAYPINLNGEPLRGGKFNNGNPKSDVDWSIYRAKQLPGPGQYDLSRSTRYLSKNTPKISFAGRPGPANMPQPYASFGGRPYTTSLTEVSMGSTMDADGTEIASQPSPRRSVSPQRSDLTSSRRNKDLQSQHVERMKKAFVRGSMKRRQQQVMGFGGSFFM